MSNFNDQLSRMKDLINYGSVNEEAKPISTYSLEYKAQAADGRYYGIVRENSKYFVKVATPGKETIAEAYQYIGGIMNKANYEYNSYTNALKQFELKLGSINEACDENRKVNVEALDPYKKEDLVIEGTEKMKNELARQRQIMRNACVIMNEATEIGSTPFKSQPEAEHANSGDKDYPFTKEGKPEEDRGAIKFDGGDPEKHSSTFGPDSNDVEDYNLDGGATPKVKNSVASENPSGGKVARVNEAYEGTGLDKDFNGSTAKLINIVSDKHPEGVEVKNNNGEVVFIPADEIKVWGEDMVAVTQEAYDRYMNGEGENSGEVEECGAMAECGTGLMPEEGEEDLELGDGPVDTEELGGDEEAIDLDDEMRLHHVDELGDDEDLDLGDEEELGDEEDLDDDEFDFGEEDDEFGDEEELGDDEDFDLDDEEELGDDEDFDLGDEEGEEFDEEPEDGEFGDEEELGDEEEDPEIELDENVVKKFRQLVRESINEMFDDEGEEEEDDEEDGEDNCFDQFGRDANDARFDNSLDEAKAAKMNSIVESVVNDILNEDELHVFGDHPGYRKKPMDLPPTGSDKFQDNRDWNDDSVHSEEPFGKGKGDSTPFDEIVAQITDSVMKQINENKKKVK